ncbi:MAG TPA: PP0621 family protein [Burkholderiales bacterium]|nr:PP0621 family protein [Burkholderiales bacterium]
MGRLLVLAAIVFAGIWLLRRALARAHDEDRGASPRAAEELVRCAQCGLLLPRAEAREAGGKRFCSEEHARRGARAS